MASMGPLWGWERRAQLWEDGEAMAEAGQEERGLGTEARCCVGPGVLGGGVGGQAQAFGWTASHQDLLSHTPEQRHSFELPREPGLHDGPGSVSEGKGDACAPGGSLGHPGVSGIRSPNFKGAPGLLRD